MTKLTKVSMKLNNHSLSNVDALSEMMSEPNKTRVVSTSLHITRRIMEHIVEGSEIIVRSKNRDERIMNIIIE